MRFAFIESEKAQWPVVVMCRVLDVSRSGFYAWRRRPVSAREREDVALGAQIAAVHSESRGTYGVPRVHATLKAQGRAVGRKRVGRLMRVQGLKGRRKRRFRVTTDSRHSNPVAANVLERRFATSAPDTAWVGDITYVWTREGWLYLAALIDLFSRRVVGWAMSDRMTEQLAIDALQMALRARRPASGMVHHSDRGSQYCSHAYRRVLASWGAVCSMSRKGDCWDNAVAESFFATLKTELIHHADYETRAEARSEIFEYIEVFYNRHRRHSTLGFVSPAEYEMLGRDSMAA